MLGVAGSMRSGVLQLPVRGICYATFNRRSAPSSHACSAPVFVKLPAVRCHTLPVRTLSGVGTPSGTMSGLWTSSGVGTPAGVRRLSGGGGVDGAGTAGWYSSLSDSTPVHLCENFLVSVQQASGLPWWLSIVTATLSVRTLITLPLAAYQMVIIAKVSDRARGRRGLSRDYI